MDLFAQNKLLVRIVILFAVLNAVSIGIFLWKEFPHRPPQLPPLPRERNDVASVLQKELHLSERQADQFSKLRAGYLEKEEALMQSLRNERDSMNTAMFSRNTDDSRVLALARRIADNEYKMELLRFDQARELKSFCTPEQLEKFERLVIEIRDYFRPDNQPPGQRPSGNEQSQRQPPRSGDQRPQQGHPKPDNERQQQRPPHPDDARN